MKDTNFKKKAVKHKPEKELRTRKGTPFKKSVPLMMKKQKSEANSIPPEIAASLLAGEDNVPDFPRGAHISLILFIFITFSYSLTFSMISTTNS